MVVGIVAANNIRFSPYIFYYTKILEELQVEYELIFPNRLGVKDDFPKTVHEVEWKKNVHPMLSYISYVKQVKTVVKRNNYDFLIILTGNNAVFLSLWLKAKYDKKYIVDIRDYTHENIKPYYWLENIAVNHSSLNIISSNLSFLFIITLS